MEHEKEPIDKVYLVWCGEYSDKYVAAVFTTREQAEEYQKLNDSRNIHDIVEEIEEMPLNKAVPKLLWETVLGEEGDIRYQKECFGCDKQDFIVKRGSHILLVRGYGETKEGSLKDARDRLAMAKAHQEGLC